MRDDTRPSIVIRRKKFRYELKVNEHNRSRRLPIEDIVITRSVRILCSRPIRIGPNGERCRISTSRRHRRSKRTKFS